MPQGCDIPVHCWPPADGLAPITTCTFGTTWDVGLCGPAHRTTEGPHDSVGHRAAPLWLLPSPTEVGP
jgi:hypothetical protein